MRKLLFRGKRKDNGEWVYGYLYRLSERLNPFIMFVNSNAESHEVISKTVGQFSGLTDKNGKEIFENDIIVDDEEYSTFENTRKGIVKFYHGEFTSFYGQDLLGCDCYDSLYSICKERYVIGNIYDNPELEEE